MIHTDSNSSTVMKDNDVLVFAHMMKTAGTSVIKNLVEYNGPKVHYVPGGLILKEDNYCYAEMSADFAKLNGRISIMAGHKLRPYNDFGSLEDRLKWITFFREPKKRFVSHFFHNKYKTKSKHKTFEKWIEVLNNKNYQTRFICGEENVEKAIEILERKFVWVGITEELTQSLESLSCHLELAGIDTTPKFVNQNSVSKDEMSEFLAQYRDEIEEYNRLDTALYDYVKKNIWSKYKVYDVKGLVFKNKSEIAKKTNILLWQFYRQTRFRNTKITRKNLIIFYKRWFA